MNKIVIIGSTGTGKSTLARKLHIILKVKTFHLDRIFWQSNWKEKNRDIRIELLKDLLLSKQWIIDGDYFSTSTLHLDAADVIIFLDMPPLLCFHRVLQRYREYHKRPRRDIPIDGTDRLTPWRLFKALTFPFQGRRQIEQELHNHSSKQIIRLHSTEEVDNFLAYCTNNDISSFNTNPEVKIHSISLRKFIPFYA